MPEARAEQALDLLVDTGNPCEVIIDIATMLRSS
jgi:hypothetical protein